MDFYIHLGFEARDVIQEADTISSMKLIYRDNEDATILFMPISPQQADKSDQCRDFILRIEERLDELPEHLRARYGSPKQLSVKDPNGYQLEFVRI